jgi:KUP system potassium uptake protein
VINWALMVMVILLVLTFQTSSNLTAAYGIAVTGAMFIDTCLLAVVLFTLWKWNRLGWRSRCSRSSSSSTSPISREPHQGAGRRLVPAADRRHRLHPAHHLGEGPQADDRADERGGDADRIFIKSAANSAARVPGTAVFMTTTPDGVPHALLHNLKHNKVLHERVMLLTVEDRGRALCRGGPPLRHEGSGSGFYRLIIRFGFMQETDVPAALQRVETAARSSR